MSADDRKRKLIQLRVSKHRAIRKELHNEQLDVRNTDIEDENERSGIISSDEDQSEPVIHPVYTRNDESQSSPVPDLDNTSSDEGDVSENEVPLQDLYQANDNNDSTDASSYVCSDIEGIDEQQNNEVELIREWAISSNVTCADLDRLLKILRRRLLPQLPQSSKTFLQTSKATYNIVEMEDCNEESGQFIYFGIAEGLCKHINKDLHRVGDRLQLQFNIDGMQIAKSSFSQAWPILCKVFHNPDVYSPFPIAIYCGPSKPKSMNNYLEQFIEEMNALSEFGIVIDGKRLEVSIQSFICDTPARAMLKCIKGHTGFYACERCHVEGFKVDWTTVFPSVDSEERTDDTFRNRSHPQHHNPGISPLLRLEPPIDIIKTFVIDSMHLISGVVKKLITYWVMGNLPLRLPLHERSRLSARLIYLKSSVPCEFQRKPRAVKYITKWKATELRFFCLYAGPIVLREILNINLYKHFLLLSVATRILCSPELALEQNRYAKIYLRSFFMALREYYGSTSQVMNAHNLIHVADDALNMQCELSRISAFPFENTLGTVIKKCIRSQNRPLAQICRRLYEQTAIHKKVIPPPLIEILKWSNKELQHGLGIQKLKYKGYTLSINKPDNKVILETGDILKINRMHCAENDFGNITIRGSIWKIKKSIFTYPCDSKHLKMWELMDKPSSRNRTFNINCVSNKMVMLVLPQIQYRRGHRIRYDRKFIMPLLHS